VNEGVSILCLRMSEDGLKKILTFCSRRCMSETTKAWFRIDCVGIVVFVDVVLYLKQNIS
jgi:hypothetical protein